MAVKPLNLLLDSSLWTQELADELTAKGHTVTHYISTLEQPIDAIIGFNCWRIPPMVPVTDVRKHLDTIIKQIRATKHDVQNTTPSTTPKRARAKPRKAPRGKRESKETGSVTTTPAQAEGQPGTASVNA